MSKFSMATLKTNRVNYEANLVKDQSLNVEIA